MVVIMWFISSNKINKWKITDINVKEYPYTYYIVFQNQPQILIVKEIEWEKKVPSLLANSHMVQGFWNIKLINS